MHGNSLFRERDPRSVCRIIIEYSINAWADLRHPPTILEGLQYNCTVVFGEDLRSRMYLPHAAIRSGFCGQQDQRFVELIVALL